MSRNISIELEEKFIAGNVKRFFFDYLPALLGQIPIHFLIIGIWRPPALTSLGYVICLGIILALSIVFWIGRPSKKSVASWLVAATIFSSVYFALYDQTVYAVTPEEKVQTGLCYSIEELTPKGLALWKKTRYAGDPVFFNQQKLMEQCGDATGAEERIWKPWALKLANILLAVFYCFTAITWSVFIGLIYTLFIKKKSL
jgi:hypothetical protein